MGPDAIKRAAPCQDGAAPTMNKKTRYAPLLKI